MKKSVVFLINGLGIEKSGSYSIAIDQIMPNFSKMKETSFYTSAVTSSLEYKGAYQRFFLGNTYKLELDYIKNNLINESLPNNETYKKFKESATIPNTKVHFFVEPTNNKVVEEINDIINTIALTNDKKVYLHLLLSQQTTNEYDDLISIINYIKFHLNSHITVGFIIGKESISDNITKEELDYTKKLLFMCSSERWSETDKKLLNLKEQNIRPCEVKGFCTNNDCYISNNDTIVFFNTRRDNYDNFITSILNNSKEMYKDTPNLYLYSLVSLFSKYAIPSFIDNIKYDNNLSEILSRNNKKALIVSDDKNIKLVNFYANGLNSINNPNISFVRKDDNLYNKEYINNLINNTIYDLFIFDYHMDTSSTVNHMKEELSKIDIILGNIIAACVNKNTLIITSLYGLKKELPIADYNTEKVIINYEMQIPIFLFDYTYPRSKYDLFPGEADDILSTALKCIINAPNINTLLRPKTIVGSVFKSFIR